MRASEVELSRLPVIQKRDLMANFDRVVTIPDVHRERVEAHLADVVGDELLYPGGLRAMCSAGSTGERGLFLYSEDEWAWFLASLLRWTELMGIRPALRRPRIAAIGAPDAKHMTFRGAASLDVGLFATLRLSATAPLATLVSALNRHQPDYLNAYPSIAAMLAEEQLAGRLRIAPRSICTSSELRTPEMTRAIRQAFGCEPFNCYALTEVGVAAADCDQHNGLHVFEDLTMLEVVGDDYRAVSPGVPGSRLLVTSLYNRTLPMIRVEVSDVLVFEADEACGCGRRLRRLRALEGRADDVLCFGAPGQQARRVHPIQLRHAIVGFDQVRQYRISQTESGLDVEVVLPPDVSSETAQRTCSNLVAALRGVLARSEVREVIVTVRPVLALAREPGAGKLKLVRSLPSVTPSSSSLGRP
jgi:phenylacetate-coenzyme A ligase PaaK-like adenylate-forming protein